MELFKLRLSPVEMASRLKATVIHSTAGEQEDESSLPFIDNGKDWRTTLIKTLESAKFNANDFQQDGEQDWMVKAGFLTEDRQAFHPDLLKNIGRSLYQSLFPSGGKLESILKSALHFSESKNTNLHIQLTFQEDSVSRSRFADYPWELLHDGKNFLAHRRVTFSRYIAYESVPPNLPATEKLNVLLVSSAAFDADQGLKKLSKQEQQAIALGLEKAQTYGHIKLVQLEFATLQCLRTYLTEHQGIDTPHVLHFDGHGLFGKRCPNPQCRTIHKGIKVERCKVCSTPLPEAQGYLAFETDAGSPDYVSAEELGFLLQTATATDGASQSFGITLAVLSACQSGMSVVGDSVFNGTAQNLISHRIPAVVAMQYSVSVDGATKFAEQFYRSLGQKNSLALAVSQGREAMGLATQQWFRPVLYLRWGDNVGGQIFDILPPSDLRQLPRRRLVGIAASVTFLIFVLRILGMLQGLELKVYDRLMGLRLLDEGRDDSILIVQITDNDVKNQKTQETVGNLQNTTLNSLLEKLEEFQPSLIGLDVYRDSAKDTILGNRLKGDLIPVVGVCKVPYRDIKGDTPSPDIPPARIGFSDFTYDSDDVIRRYVMSMETKENATCTAKESFSLVLAKMYLKSKNYQYKKPIYNPYETLKFNSISFLQIQSPIGGYQTEDMTGYQVLLNYRSRGPISIDGDLCFSQKIAKCVNVEDILNNRVEAEKIKGKIVLIGYSGTNISATRDSHMTPYGNMSGVLIHANMISQVINTVKDGRSQLYAFPQGVEYLWIFCWSLTGIFLTYIFRFSWQKVAISIGGELLVLSFICLGSLSWGSLWLPLIPSVLALMLANGSILYIVYRPHKLISNSRTKT